MPDRLLRGALLGLGVLGMAVGVSIGVREVPVRQWWPVARWLVGGIVVHDLVLAPAAVVLAFLVLRRAPAGWRSPLRAALLTVGALGLVAAAVLVASTMRQNASVLPAGAPVVLGGVALAVLLVTLVAAVAERPRRRGRAPR